jgi:proline iminopeptidase
MRRLILIFLLAGALPLSGKSFRSHDGTTLHYEIVGRGAPVVLLSGGPGFSPDYLRPVAARLRHRYRFVLFEQRGTGRSRIDTYNAETMELKKLVGDLEALRKELGVEKLTLVGHSYGGILSMMYASEHPERIGAVAFVDAGGPTLAGVPKFSANLNARFTDEDNAKIREWSSPERMQADRKKAVLEITRAKTPAYFHDRAKAVPMMESLTVDSFNDAAFWAIVAQFGAGLDLRAGLREVHAPVLVIHGKQDPLETAGEVHEAFPGSKLEMIDQAGHFPWLEQPETFYRVLDRFLAKVVQR